MNSVRVALRNAAKSGLVAFGCLCLSSLAIAQQSTPESMTPDELEAHIAEQKAALQTVIENRDLTKSKVEEVQEQLAEAAAKEEAIKEELAELCDAREELEAGSGEACRQASGI